MNLRSALRCTTVLVGVLAIGLQTTAARAEPYDLVATFGDGGIARLPRTMVLQDAAAYPDGRVALLAGQRVMRIDASGRIDPAFSAVEALPSFMIDSIAVSPSGRLMALQNRYRSPDGETRITSHLDNGSPDPAFGVAGNALVRQFPYSIVGRIGEWGEFSHGLAVDRLGRPHTATQLRDPVVSATWIARVASNGSSVEQLHRTDPTASRLYYGPLIADGEAVVALVHGYLAGQPGGADTGAPAVMRLVGGVPDPAFAWGSGLAFRPVPGWWSTWPGHGVYDLASTPDGGYVVAGLAEVRPGLFQLTLVKFARSGQPDNTFGEAGIASVDLVRAGELATRASVAVQPDGRIVVAATITHVVEGSFVSNRIGIARLKSDGQPDTLFAPGGVASFWTERGASAEHVFIRPDGRILVIGKLVMPWDGTSAEQAAAFLFAGGDMASPRPLPQRRAVEYFHAGFGHYFVSADAEEIMNLDAFNPGGWARTGRTFAVWDGDDPSLAPTCRFWSDQTFAPKSSHFYTPYDAECAAVKASPAWRFERNAFAVKMPQGAPGARTCPADSRSLYRAWNSGQGGATNHRYTTERIVLAEMIAMGWTMEGEAQTQVFACVPLD